MVGTAAQEIKEELKQEYERQKDKWVSEAKNEGKLENTQEMIIAAFQNRLGVVKPRLA